MRDLLSKNVNDDEVLESVMESMEENKSELTKLLKTTKSSSKKKDPNAPKRPLSAYLFFCQSERPLVKEEFPDMKGTNVMRELSVRWNKTSEEDRESFHEMAENDKKRYAKDMESYVPPETNDDDEDVPKKDKKTKKDKTGPKRPRSAYLYFCQDVRSQVNDDNPEMNGKEVMKELGRLWKELSDKDKIPYNELSSKDKARYESEKAGTPVKEPSKKAKRSSKKQEVEPVSDVETDEVSAPKKKRSSRSKTGYDLFCKDMKAEMKEANPKLKGKKLKEAMASEWRDLEEDERDEWNERASDSLATK